MNVDALTTINPKIAEAVRWPLSNPPVGARIILRTRFGLSTTEIIQVWRLAAEKRS